ncbi:unnamed protein product [Protopolystoma xenopodis]|uniref:Uncharacterized protein n=1 Tax=Protopolystoma xenopodis TaxID=117903 RepID=A0A3S5A3G7_9PLAT|nr:unnamed protein product [Protopolystoma xenopodis]
MYRFESRRVPRLVRGSAGATTASRRPQALVLLVGSKVSLRVAETIKPTCRRTLDCLCRRQSPTRIGRLSLLLTSQPTSQPASRFVGCQPARL